MVAAPAAQQAKALGNDFVGCHIDCTMNLTLRVVSLNDQPLTRPIVARFDANGGTIGRADHSTLALPDPERFISRKQAEIAFVNGDFLIRNVGAANPIQLGARTLAGGEASRLAHGDDVRIGGYLLRAECSTEKFPSTPEPVNFSQLLRTAAPVSQPAPAHRPTPAPLAASSPAEPPPAPGPSQPFGGGNPFADLLGGVDHLGSSSAPAASWGLTPADADPFADLLGGATPKPPAAPGGRSGGGSGSFEGWLPPAAGLSVQSAAVAAPLPPAARLPDDFDPMGGPSPSPSLAPRHGSSLDPFADLSPRAPPASIDEQFNLSGAGSGNLHRDPLKDFEFDLGALGGTPAPGAGAPSGTDPMAMFSPTPPAAGAGLGGLPMQDHLPGVHGAFEAPWMVPPARAQTHPAAAPPVQAAQPVQPAPPAAAPPPHAAAGNAMLWQAFCDGAGLQLPMPADPALAALRMRQVGMVLRAAVAGTRELMAVRASTKYELRASVTMIQAKRNNPLKFAPDVETGIEQLVQPATAGFLEGPAAMDDAMRDLVGHSIGSVAGMRAALEGLLDRFDPATLESTLGGSLLDNLLPLNRRSRLWELYLQKFRTIREEAQEDFHALFGKAFVAAYEQQVARLNPKEQSARRPLP